jgi:hypothetical protein
MASESERKTGNWLSNTNQIFSKKGANRLEWLMSQTPRASHWVFPGGAVTINLFEAASYCFVNGQFLGAMVMGLSYIEHTLAGLFVAAGRKELENARAEVLAREAMMLSILKQGDFDIIKEAAHKRDAKLRMRRIVESVSSEDSVIEENERDSAVYEEDGRKIMSVVIRLLDKKMI